MKKKVGIITLNGNNNFGNKLQNYALKKIVESYGLDVDTIWFDEEFNYKKYIIKKFMFFKKIYKREIKFEKFTQKYLNRKFFCNESDQYYKFIVGSDQVWNYSFKGVSQNFYRYFLKFSPKEKNISYAASIGANQIEDKYVNEFKDGMNNFSFISVREDLAKKILNEQITSKEVEVVLDPTMLLSSNEWNFVAKKPKKFPKKRYILNYFLGEQSKERKKIINNFAKKNNCQVIDLLDENNPLYVIDPTEFLYLEKNAFLICTDSFHSCVFSIIFNRPFVVFDREDNGKKVMGSRIDTLINKFNLLNRKFNGIDITNENLKHDYSNAYEILENEKKKSKEFLKKSLNVE